MKKPSKRKAREYWICVSYRIQRYKNHVIFHSKEHAKDNLEYLKDRCPQESHEVVHVREVLPRRRK